MKPALNKHGDAISHAPQAIVVTHRGRAIPSLVLRYRTALLLPALLAALLGLAAWIHPGFGAFDVQSLALVALPLALAAAAQTVVVIGGGIDLSVGSLMAVSNVLAARTMQGASLSETCLLAFVVLVVGTAVGGVNGLIIVASEVPDVVVTLTTGFIWGGVALLILNQPGGGAPEEFVELGAGQLWPWVPNALVLLLAIVILIWVPISRTRLFLGIQAVGSDRTAAFRSGIDVMRSVVASYAIGGLFCALGGLFLVMTTGIGSPLGSAHYTLSSIAAIVLGGVSLTGGRGQIFGPMLGTYILSFIPAILIFLEIDPNYGEVIQGGLIVGIVMAAGYFQLAGRSTQ
jgi:ribose transport system permease protein